MTTFAQEVGICFASPWECLTRRADESYRVGRVLAGGAYAGPTAAEDLAKLADRAEGAGSVIVRDVRDAIDASARPIEAISDTARWVGIGILAVLAIVIVVAGMYFAAPILGVLR